MTASEKILLEKNRHLKKVDELKNALETEYNLYEKNIDDLKKEELEEKLAKFGFAQEVLLPISPLPVVVDKLLDEEILDVNSQLREINNGKLR